MSVNLPDKKNGWLPLTRHTADQVLGCRVQSGDWRRSALDFLDKLKDPQKPDGEGVPVLRLTQRHVYFRYDIFQERLSLHYQAERDDVERIEAAVDAKAAA